MKLEWAAKYNEPVRCDALLVEVSIARIPGLVLLDQAVKLAAFKGLFFEKRRRYFFLTRFSINDPAGHCPSILNPKEMDLPAGIISL